MLFNKLSIGIIFLFSDFLFGQDDCFDYELAASSFPFNHLSSLEFVDDTWPMENIGGAGGSDFTFKLVLLEPTSIYVTTCDPETYLDVELAIYSSCDPDSWMLYQDDATTEIYYPDGTSESFLFECQSGIIIGGVPQTSWANMFPLLNLDAGDYYIAIGNRNDAEPEGGNPYTIKTWIGHSLIVDSITTSNDYSEINYYFSEGVFGGEYIDVYNDSGIALEVNDYSLEIDSNGGNANEAYITSLSTMLGGVLLPGAENIKINIDYPIAPSGVELVTIGPINESSIFNSIGIPLLNLEGITIELVDAISPIIESVQPTNNAEGVSANSNIILTFSEQVFYDGNEINNENALNCFRLENADTGQNLGFELSNLGDITFTINPEDDFSENTYIRLVILSSIEDFNENHFISNTITFRTEDITPPIIDNISLSTTNEYIIITFSESVYSNNSGSGALSLSDFSLNFDSNNGNCQDVSLVGLANNYGAPLTGGESIIQILLQLESAPSGVETFFINPQDSYSIFDLSGNSMSINSLSSELTLYASAMIDTFFISDSNEYVDLTFSVGVYGDGIQVQPVLLSDFTFQLNLNEGPVSSGNITGIYNINNDPLSGGETIIRIFMSFDTLPSGVENIIIFPTSDNSIYSLSGVSVPSSENSGEIPLFDQRPPEASPSILDGEIGILENGPLRITFTENLYNPTTGALMTQEDFQSFITLRIGDSLGTEIPFLIDYDSPPDLYIIPIEDFSSEEEIYYAFNGSLEDEAGNQIEFNFNAVFTIRDYLPPSVDSVELALDNSYLDVIFDDGVFGEIEFDGTDFLGITPVDRNDFDIEFDPNGSEIDLVEITSITRTDSNFLIGGESEIRVNFNYNGTPNGDETLKLIVRDGVTIYDEVGNEMTDATIIMQKDTLYDILAPTINNVSVPIDSFITLTKERPIKFTFNEKIDSLRFSINSMALDYVNFESSMVESDSSIEIILKPPFASFDQITINFIYLKDEAGLTTVDIAYTYLTPMLGDYDHDNSITYSDLWNLVDNWNPPADQYYEIGPVVGKVPHLIPQLDGKFDIEDGMAFVQMWSWYQKEYGEIIEDSIQVGRSLELSQNNGKYIIFIDSTVFAGQLKFLYEIESSPIRFFEYPNGNNKIYIKNHIQNKGYSIIEFARTGVLEEDSILIDIESSSKVNLFYTFSTSSDTLLRKGMVRLNNTIFPDKIKLYSAYPNPFNPVTTIKFDVPKNSSHSLVSLIIYDLRGREISKLINSSLSSGTYISEWNGQSFSSGMYIVKLIIGSTTKTQKIILLK